MLGRVRAVDLLAVYGEINGVQARRLHSDEFIFIRTTQYEVSEWLIWPPIH